MNVSRTNTRDGNDRGSPDRTDFRTWIEASGFLALILALGLNVYQAKLLTKTTQAQLFVMAEEMLRSTAAQSDSSLTATNGEATDKEMASAARYVLERAVESGTPLIGFDASHATLTAANLAGADLRGASLRGTTLVGADLTGARLSPYPAPTPYAKQRSSNRLDLRTKLRNADLRGAVLVGADLSQAILSQADLTEADLSDANLTGADLTGTVLSNADLSRVSGLQQVQLETACGNARTQLANSLELSICPQKERLAATEETVVKRAASRIVDRDATIATTGPQYSAFTGRKYIEDSKVEDEIIQGESNALETAPPIRLALEEGVAYRFVGICDEDCSDLDLVLYGPNGNEVDSDHLTDAVPIIEHTANGSGDFRLEVVMVSCDVEPCGWAVLPLEGKVSDGSAFARGR